MKKISIMVASALCLMVTGCGTLGTGTSTGTGTSDVLGGILGAITNGQTVGNVLGSIIGLDKIPVNQLYGSWNYNGPGCAFTSDNALARAGGEIAATQIKEKLQPQYDKLGIKASNTQITFNQNGTFTAVIGGRSLSGNYTYDPNTSALTMQSLLLNMNAYVTRNTQGISVLFESKKLLSLLQTVSALSGNTTLSTIGDISQNFDGVRLGFDMAK